MAARLSELEARKAAAVAGEDYDAAKGVKAEIDRVRAAAGAPAAGADKSASSPWVRRCADVTTAAGDAASLSKLASEHTWTALYH